VDVAPVPGAFIINLGDMLERSAQTSCTALSSTGCMKLSGQPHQQHCGLTDMGMGICLVHEGCPACTGSCNLSCRWTNGLFKSTLHRVVNTVGKERYSCAFFFEPNFNTRVEVLPCCVSEHRPAAYPPTTAGEHLLGKYAQTHAGYDVNHKQERLAGVGQQIA